jgi:hypothetical protein
MEFESSIDFYNWLNTHKTLDGSLYGPEFEAYAKMQRFLLDKSICNCKKKNKNIDSYYENLNKMSDENQRKLLEALNVESILLKKESNIVAELRTQVLEKS